MTRLPDSNPDKRPLAEPDSAKVALGSDLPAGPEDPGPSGSASGLEVALTEEWCNGCGLPRKHWGPVCGGMTQGDWTHYHSPEWWRHRLEPRPDYDPHQDHPERFTEGPI